MRFFYPGGYLSDRKPTAETIAAFQRVRDPRARLILKIQDPVRGPQLAAEAERADPRIRVITADLPDDEHHRLMASCDVLLAPTRWEGLGLHHGEAIALGLPAITNDFPPMNENVTHDVDGWLVPAVWQTERVPDVPRLETPVEPLAEAIEALCDDDRRAQAGRRRRPPTGCGHLGRYDTRPRGAHHRPARDEGRGMTLILQGMRRSGTTIVYDALAQDPALTLWYEPLAAAVKPAIGGGSGAREVDPFEGLRAARTEFLAARGLADPALLNLGGPRDAALEFDREFPPLVADYLRFLLDRPGPVAAKFTPHLCQGAGGCRAVSRGGLCAFGP